MRLAPGTLQALDTVVTSIWESRNKGVSCCWCSLMLNKARRSTRLAAQCRAVVGRVQDNARFSVRPIWTRSHIHESGAEKASCWHRYT
jgi:hypothetical protein